MLILNNTVIINQENIMINLLRKELKNGGFNAENMVIWHVYAESIVFNMDINGLNMIITFDPKNKKYHGIAGYIRQRKSKKNNKLISEVIDHLNRE